MVQQQLVDYIKSQIKLGLDRDSIKNALVSAGWPAEDVEDSMKGLAPVSGGATSGSANLPQSAVSPIGSVGGGVGKGNTQATGPIVISDLFNNSKLGTMPAASGDKKIDAAKLKSASISAETVKGGDKPKFGKQLIIIIALAVIAVGLGVGMVMLYFQNSSAQSQLSGLQTQVSAANSKITALTSEVADLTTQRDNIKSSADLLTAKNLELLTELSFIFAPAGATSTENSQFTIKGVLTGGGKAQYSLLTAEGMKVMVKNYKDAGVDAALAPLVGQMVEISGTHTLGSANVSVTAVNGSAITAPASTSTVPASTSTLP